MNSIAPKEMKMRTSLTETDRGPIFARHWGADHLPRLLMLHGFPEYSGAWEELAEQLQHRFHCIAPDQRGYGQTGGPDDVAAYRTSELVRDMLPLIADAPLIVLGHDWGAAVAYGLAMRHPALVKQLIIANGVHPVPFQQAMAAGGAQSAASQYILSLRRDGSETHYAADNFAKLQQLFSANMDFNWFTGTKRDAYLAEWARPGRLKTMIHWYRASPLQVARPGQPITDLPEFPKDQLMIQCPHLLIWGDGDTALLPQSTEGLEEFAPDLTRVTLPDADHWLAHQKPQDMAAAILSWLDARPETA